MLSEQMLCLFNVYFELDMKLLFILQILHNIACTTESQQQKISKYQRPTSLHIFVISNERNINFTIRAPRFNLNINLPFEFEAKTPFLLDNKFFFVFSFRKLLRNFQM